MANERLRQARLHRSSPTCPGEPMSRAELVAQVNTVLYGQDKAKQACSGFTTNYLGKLERGIIVWPRTPQYRAALRTVLKVDSDEELGFVDPGASGPADRRAQRLSGSRERREASSEDAQMLAAAADCHHTATPAGNGRRDAVQVSGESAGVSVGLAHTAPDDAVIVTVVVNGRMQRIRLSRRAVLGAITGVLTPPPDNRAPTRTGRTVDPAVVDHFAVLRALLVRSDDRLGAASVLPTVYQQLSHIAGLRRQTGGWLHDRLLRTEARWAEFAGWLSDDLGDWATGDWWLGRALSMAQEADDAELSAYVFARMAQRAREVADEDRVAGLARAASRIGSVPVQVRAFAALQRAHGFAVAGEIPGFQRVIDEARTLTDRRHAPDGQLASFCTAAYTWVEEGRGWLHLGFPRNAARCFDQALAVWGDSNQRDRGLCLSFRSAALAASGEPDGAAATALEALSLARSTASSRIRREVAAVGNRLAVHHGDESSVKTLLSALASAPETS